MEKLHKQAKHDKTKVKQRSVVHPMLANAELQIEDKALKIISRSQSVSFDIYIICIRTKNL